MIRPCNSNTKTNCLHKNHNPRFIKFLGDEDNKFMMTCAIHDDSNHCILIIIPKWPCSCLDEHLRGWQIHDETIDDVIIITIPCGRQYHDDLLIKMVIIT